MDFTFRHRLKCPFCGKGEILTDQIAKVSISTVCPICNNLYFANLYSLRTYRPKEARTIGKNRPYYISIRCPNKDCGGELRADGEANVRVSLRCAKRNCKRFYIVDLQTLQAYPSVPVKKHGRKTA